jgi:ATP-dependent Lon protease
MLKKNRPDPKSDSESSEGEWSDCDSYVSESSNCTSDSSYQPPKPSKKSALKSRSRRVIESDSEDENESDSSSSDSEDESDSSSSESEYVKSRKNKKLQSKPTKKSSKNTKTKPKSKILSKSRSKYESESESDDSDSENDSDDYSETSYVEPKKKSSSSSRSNTKKGKSLSSKHNKRRVIESDSEDENDSDYSEEEENVKGGSLFTFFINGGDSEDEEEYVSDDENEECNSDDEKTFMKETYREMNMPEKSKKDKKKSKKDKKAVKKTFEEEIVSIAEKNNIESEYKELQELKTVLFEKLKKNPKSKALRKAIEECKQSSRILIKKARSENTKSYHKLLHGDKQKTSEIDYFKKKLSNKEQLTIMKDLHEINKHLNIEKPYRLALLQSTIPPNLKAIAMQKLNMLSNMEPGDSEYHKVKNWVDTFMRIPFGVYKSQSVDMKDGIDTCDAFLTKAKNILDTCVYGLEDAKLQTMQMLGQWISNPDALGTAIAIKGPPGTGKTSLIKDGISKILGREFAFIALGGAGDSSFLEGHSYTYEGSTWGKIVQILIDSKCMNPIIYFDELDKISDTPRGQEIIGVLTHLTDTTQNTEFRDKYFCEFGLDLSKCLFIFSYNDESLVNPILKDRMYRIQTKGYNTQEKLVIARDYLLPKIREQVNFKAEEVIIPDEAINYINNHAVFTKNEEGVRNMKRCIEIIYTKLNLFRLVKPDNKLFANQLKMNITFPHTVTTHDVETFIKTDEKQSQSLLAMYV